MATRPDAAAENGSRFLISDLCKMLESYLDEEQVQDVYRAYLFGAEAHEGQHRLSGEPYIYHPIAAARILAELRLDHKTIMAAILHDVIPGDQVDENHLEELFSSDVVRMVRDMERIGYASRGHSGSRHKDELDYSG